MKKKRTKWSKIENNLSINGLPTPLQFKRINVIRRLRKNDPRLASKPGIEVFELTFAQFVSCNAKETVGELTGYRSAVCAEEFLKIHYLRIIIAAVEQRKSGVNVEGIEMLRFRPRYMELIKDYCKEKKILLD